MFFLKREPGQGLRVGVTVTRKTGPAFLRNRIKRVVREFFRLNQKALNGPYDLVVIPKRTLDGKRIGLDLVHEELYPLVSGFLESDPP